MRSKILIVEDQRSLADFITDVLVEYGYDVATIIPSGSPVIDEILKRQSDCDLVLMDVMMPGISGLGMLAHVREHFSRSEFPVIMMTGLSNSEDVVRALDQGANDYITKPIDIPVAIARIKTQLQLKQAEAQLTELNESLERRVRERTHELEKLNEKMEAEIAERMRTENKLVRLASFPDRNPHPIIEIDLDGNITYINPAASTLFPDLSLGASNHPLVSGLSEWIDEIRQGEQGFAIREIAYDGAVHEQHVSLVKESSLVRLYLFEITKRKHAIQALAASEERFRLLAENSTDMISKHTADGVYQYVSPACRSLLGMEPGDLTGHSIFEFCHDNDLDDVHGRFAGIVKHGDSTTLKYRIRKKDMLYTWFETTFTALPNAEPGKISEIQAASRDITQRLLLEEELNQSHKMEAIGVLAAGIAHEINTPIQFIGHNTRFVSESVDEILQFVRESRDHVNPGDMDNTAEILPALRESLNQFNLEYFLDQIPRALNENLEGIDRVVTIISAMKEFSHTGQEQQRKVAFDLNRALQNAAILARNEIKYVADIEFHLIPNLPLISCYANDLNQVFLNLLVNAAHAIADKVDTSIGERGIISATSRVGGEAIEISIADSGSGIPTEIQDRIFEPFFTTKDIGKGTGMGLSLAHDIVVKKHGGRLSFKTELGHGTCFTISLPIEAKNSLTTDNI